MTRRSKLIILLVLLLLAILLLIWLLISFRKAATPPTEGENPMPLPVGTEIPREREEPEPEPVVVQNASVQSLSKTFAERYGSYSNESEFANLTDVLPLMTDSFASQTEVYIDTTVASPEYYGVTTHVLSVNVESMDETAGTATVRVETQREEATGSIQNVRVKYQTLVLNLLQVNGQWFVNAATWL